MAKTLMKALHTEMSADLPAVAALLQKKGRGKDTILAHITPKEAALLKERGGRGSKNPDTGLLEFEGGDEGISFGEGYAGTPAETEAAYNIPQTETPAFSGGAAPSTGGVQAADQAAAMQAPAYSPQYTPPVAPTPSAMGSLANIPAAAGGTLPAGGGVSAQMGQSGTDFVPPTPAVGPGVTTTSATPPAPPTKSFLDSLGLGGISGGQALGGAVLGGLGAIQARNAASQGQQAKNQLQALATPYQAQGAQQVSAAQAGQLSTASQQAYQAAQARAAQAAASGGISGAGVVQVNAQLENLRQQLLQGDLNIGLQIQSIGDKIAQGAIQAGVQADQYVNSLTSNYATNIARTIAGLGSTPQTPTTPTGP